MQHTHYIFNENNASNQWETVDSELRDKVKLFQMYVSACELKGPRSKTWDNSDESIHHGRNSCAISKFHRDSQSLSTLDSFLLKSGRRSSTGTVDMHSSSSRSTAAHHGDNQLPINEKPIGRAFSSRSFSGWPCQRTQLPALGSPEIVRRRPQSGSFHRPTPADRENFDMYKTQVVAALTSGKPVWL